MVFQTNISRRKDVMILALALTFSLGTIPIQKTMAARLVSVQIVDFAFSPQSLILYVGDEAAWNNTDPVIRTLLFLRVDNGSVYQVSDPILPNEGWIFSFNDLVELEYFDLTRLWIVGWIIVTIPGDINGDKIIDIFDAILLAGAFDTSQGDPGWNPDADINGDGIIDIFDAILLAANFGDSWS